MSTIDPPRPTAAATIARAAAASARRSRAAAVLRSVPRRLVNSSRMAFMRSRPSSVSATVAAAARSRRARPISGIE
jgi:hypothetical protein